MEATPSSSATPRAKFRSRLAFWERGTGLLAQTLNITSTPGPAGPARMPLAPVALNTESSPAQAGGFKSPTTKGFSPSVSFELDAPPQPTPARECGSSFSVTPGVAQGHEKVRVPAGTLRLSESSDAAGAPPDAQPLRTPWDRPGVQRVLEDSAASQDAALSEAVTTTEAVAQDGDAQTDAKVARNFSPIACTPSASSDGAGHSWPPQCTPPPIEVDGGIPDPLPSCGKRTPDSSPFFSGPAAESFVDPIASSDAATGSLAPPPSDQREEHEREIIAITERHAKELAAKETTACDEIAHLHASLAEAKSAQLEAADLLQAYQSELTEQLETSKAALVAATSKEQAVRVESEAAAAAARADADAAHAKADAARAEADTAHAEAAAARAEAERARAAQAEMARAAGAAQARAADVDRELAAAVSAAREADARVEDAKAEAEAARRAAAEARDEAARARASVNEAETRIGVTETEAEAARQQTEAARADAEAARKAAEKAEAAWQEERARLEAELEEEVRKARDSTSSDELKSKLAEKSVQLEAVTAQMVVEKKIKEEMVEQHAAQLDAVREEVASAKRVASQREADWVEQKKSLEEQLKLREMESAAIARDAKQEMIKEAEKQFAVAKQQFSKLKVEKDALAATVAKQAQAMKAAEAKRTQDQHKAEAAISAERSRREEAEQQLSKQRAQAGEERERADKAEATAKEANAKLVESTKINVELMAMLDQ